MATIEDEPQIFFDDSFVPNEPAKEIATQASRPDNPVEVSSIPDASSLDHNGLPVSALVALHRLHPFAHLFQHWADREGSHATPQRRVTSYKKAHPTFYRVCRIGDLLVTTFVFLIIFFATIAVVYKLILS